MKTLVIILPILYITYVDMHKYTWQHNLNTIVGDWSGDCTNDEEVNMFNPYGTGIASAAVGMIIPTFTLNKTSVKCKVSFRISKEMEYQHQIIVLEYFVNNATYKDIMQECLSDNRDNYLVVTDNIEDSQPIYVCDKFKPSPYRTPVFTYVSNAQTLTLQVHPQGYVFPMKITVTAARRVDRHDHCLESSEIPCFIGRNLMCLTNTLACDGNINCGVFNDMDEDYRVCLVQEFPGYWAAVLAGLLVLIGLYIVIVYLTKSYIPKINDNFR